MYNCNKAVIHQYLSTCKKTDRLTDRQTDRQIAHCQIFETEITNYQNLRCLENIIKSVFDFFTKGQLCTNCIHVHVYMGTVEQHVKWNLSKEKPINFFFIKKARSRFAPYHVCF